MSATFKNAKKMVKQEQLRRIMKDHKKGLKDVKKIVSPLAKYNELGQLTCVLCKSVVKSESVWVVHINAKQHKENIELAKKLKERTKNFTISLKRPLTPPLVSEIPDKKLKGILKNGSSKTTDIPALSTTTNNLHSKRESSSSTNSKSNKNVLSSNKIKDPSIVEENIEEIPPNTLPEGFFDDPVMDAKARNQEYKDPLEAEWDKFLKEMKVVENESQIIINDDQDDATNERHIEEIDQQIILFNKVLDLERKKEETAEVLNKLKDEPDNEDDDFEEDIDEFLDWRRKKC